MTGNNAEVRESCADKIVKDVHSVYYSTMIGKTGPARLKRALLRLRVERDIFGRFQACVYQCLCC